MTAFENLKVALFHDALNQNGGAERVLKTFLEIFPAADLYTLIYDKNKFPELQKNIKKTSFLDILAARKNHYPFIPLMPLAAHFFNIKNDYDLIISSNSGYAKGFSVNSHSHRHGYGNSHCHPLHISYCHTPVRYAWEPPVIAAPLSPILKFWDKHTSKKPDLLIANSEFIRSKIKQFYARSAEVIHPPVDNEIFKYEPRRTLQNYYLMVGRLVAYKKFNIAVKTFNKCGRHLKIIGRGPEEKKLKQMAGKNIEFINFPSDESLKNAYNEARALIFPQVEDFGLVAAEAQMCGLPVIAYNAGGALEIIENGKTGAFFEKQDEKSLGDAILSFEKEKFNRAYIAENALRFSKNNFKVKIKDVINREFKSRSVFE